MIAHNINNNKGSFFCFLISLTVEADFVACYEFNYEFSPSHQKFYSTLCIIDASSKKLRIFEKISKNEVLSGKKHL